MFLRHEGLRRPRLEPERPGRVIFKALSRAHSAFAMNSVDGCSTRCRYSGIVTRAVRAQLHAERSSIAGRRWPAMPPVMQILRVLGIRCPVARSPRAKAARRAHSRERRSNRHRLAGVNGSRPRAAPVPQRATAPRRPRPSTSSRRRTTGCASPRKPAPALSKPRCVQCRCVQATCACSCQKRGIDVKNDLRVAGGHQLGL